VRRIACMAVLAFSLPLTGCIHMSRSVLSSAHAANPVPKERVQVYLPGDPVPSHERIAILNTRTGAGSFAESEIVERLREEAGKLGANALLLDYLSTGQTGLVAGLNGERPERRSGALAIYVDGLAADGVQSVPARAGAAPSSAAPRLLVWPGRRVRFESGGTWTGVVERTTPDSVGVLPTATGSRAPSRSRPPSDSGSRREGARSSAACKSGRRWAPASAP